MFIIFGWKQTINELGLSDEKEYCYNCHNIRKWKYIKETRWFSLFFIPVIPYNIKYFKVCPICKNSMELNKDDLEIEKYVSNNQESKLTEVQKNYREQMKKIKEERKN